MSFADQLGRLQGSVHESRSPRHNVIVRTKDLEALLSQFARLDYKVRTLPTKDFLKQIQKLMKTLYRDNYDDSRFVGENSDYDKIMELLDDEIKG